RGARSAAIAVPRRGRFGADAARSAPRRRQALQGARRRLEVHARTVEPAAMSNALTVTPPGSMPLPMSRWRMPALAPLAIPSWQVLAPMQEYCIDTWQRSILFLDILRERGNNYREHEAQIAPNVLSFKVELVRDGRTLPRPVNYALVRIVPPEGVKIDPAKRPFIVVDPRAGHGPGIGGMKQDSEI